MIFDNSKKYQEELDILEIEREIGFGNLICDGYVRSNRWFSYGKCIRKPQCRGVKYPLASKTDPFKKYCIVCDGKGNLKVTLYKKEYES